MIDRITYTIPQYSPGLSVPRGAFAVGGAASVKQTGVEHNNESVATDSKVKKNSANEKMLNNSKCKTCSERRYQDGSDDPGVSFKAPTHISPENAGAAVAAHEQEHVQRERAKAGAENKEVIAQSVRIYTAVCPECGKSYVSGGETTTTTRTITANNKANPYEPGQNVDLYA
jgi:hypothetical protein